MSETADKKIKQNCMGSRTQDSDPYLHVSVNPYPSQIGMPISSKNSNTGRLTPAPPDGMYFIVGHTCVVWGVKGGS